MAPGGDLAGEDEGEGLGRERQGGDVVQVGAAGPCEFLGKGSTQKKNLHFWHQWGRFTFEQLRL